MTDEQKPKIENLGEPAEELTTEQAEAAQGGRERSAPSVSEIAVTKSTDVSSTNLM